MPALDASSGHPSSSCPIKYSLTAIFVDTFHGQGQTTLKRSSSIFRLYINRMADNLATVQQIYRPVDRSYSDILARGPGFKLIPLEPQPQLLRALYASPNELETLRKSIRMLLEKEPPDRLLCFLPTSGPDKTARFFYINSEQLQHEKIVDETGHTRQIPVYLYHAFTGRERSWDSDWQNQHGGVFLTGDSSADVWNISGLTYDASNGPVFTLVRGTPDNRSSREVQSTKTTKTMSKSKAVGKWTLGNTIDKGGQAEVFEATCADNKSIWAIKLIRTSNEKKRSRFVREVRKHLELSQKHAPNIITIFDHNLDEFEGGAKEGFIVMPKAETTLDEQLPLLKGRIELCLEIIQGIASGIHEAHAIGVIHRDIKPPNVLFLNKSLHSPMIADFGICFIKETPDEIRDTTTNEIVGSRYFMAPEQELGGPESITERADIYSLGKLLHYMLTGRKFHREDLDKAFEQTELNSDPRVTTILQKILMRSVGRDPNARIQTAKELLEVLYEVQDSSKQSSRIQSEMKTTIPPVNSPSLPDVKAIYESALEYAQRGDILAWRKLFAMSKQERLGLLTQWRIKYEKNPPREDKDLPRMALEGIDVYSQLFCVAFAGVVSGKAKFIDQASALDEVLHPKGWNRSGLSVIVELPETAAFVFQALHGATCLQTDQLSLALNLARMRVDLDGRGHPLHKISRIIGYPPSLGRNYKTGWEFLANLTGQWPWLNEIFGDSDEYLSALCAYYMALNILELAHDIAEGKKDGIADKSGTTYLEIPVIFPFAGPEINRKAYRLLLQDKEQVRNIWKSINVTDAAMKELWPTWMKHSINSLGSRYFSTDNYLVHARLFEDLA